MLRRCRVRIYVQTANAKALSKENAGGAWSDSQTDWKMRVVRTGQIKQSLLGHSKNLSLNLRWEAMENSRQE